MLYPRPKARKVPPNTPCGYCFENLAICYDHIIPWSYKPDRRESNLYPTCQRCNNILGSLVFNSLEEKREYVRAKLNNLPFVFTLQHKLPTNPPTSSILQTQMPVGRMVTTKTRKIKPTNQYNIKCVECGNGFVSKSIRLICKSCNRYLLAQSPFLPVC